MLSLAPLPPPQPPPRNPPSPPLRRVASSHLLRAAETVSGLALMKGVAGLGGGGGARFPSTAGLSVSSPGSIHYSSSCRKSSPAQLQIL